MFVVSVSLAARADGLSFNHFRGPMSCLRSIAYRAGCPATLDANCPKIWLASARLCRGYRTSDRFAYRQLLYSWIYLRFFEQAARQSRPDCAFSRMVERRLSSQAAGGNAP
jgi:hypothetical protein